LKPVYFTPNLQPSDHESYLVEYFLANSLQPVKTQRRILFSQQSCISKCLSCGNMQKWWQLEIGFTCSHPVMNKRYTI